jgi:hypothetical protein
MSTRRQRGHETEELLARWFAARGWAQAEPVIRGRPGPDILGMPGWNIEVRARADPRETEWCRRPAAAGVPLMIRRPNGFGPGSIAIWPVTFRLGDATALMRAWED